MNIRKLLCTTIVLALVLPALAVAAEGPIIWLSFGKAKRGQSDAYTQAIVKYNSPLYSKLMAEGSVLEWGVAQPINHFPNMTYTHVEFVVFANWEGVNSFVTHFMAGMMAMSEEEKGASMAAFDAAVEPGSHYDVVERGLFMGGTSQGRPGYLNIAFYNAKPGGDFMGLFEEYGKPVLDKLSTDGKIGTYGVEAMELHGGDPGWTHLVWYESQGLGARDDFSAAWDAAAAARSAEETTAMGEKFDATVGPGHFDQVLAVVHYAVPGGGE
jgi:hypothetical protein